MLKANSKAVLDIIATQKERNLTKAYKEVHQNASLDTARSAVSALMAKPEAQLYLEEHINKAKETIVGLMNSEKDDIKLRAATDVLDRSTGKAIQRVEQHTTGVTLTIDLTSALAPNPN
jgi:hypothetical protein